jgi:Cyclic nucleotide-binding domain
MSHNFPKNSNKFLCKTHYLVPHSTKTFKSVRIKRDKNELEDFSAYYNDLIDEMEKNSESSERCIPSRKRLLTIDDLNSDEVLNCSIKIFQKKPENRTFRDLKFSERCLENVEFFQKYEKNILEQVCKYMTHFHLEKGKILFETGTIGTTFYIILKGSVEIWIPSPKEVEEINCDGTITKKIQTVFLFLKNLNHGQAFGELALIEKKPRSATIITKDDCDFGVIDKESFERILSIFYNLR